VFNTYFCGNVVLGMLIYIPSLIKNLSVRLLGARGVWYDVHFTISRRSTFRVPAL